MSRTTTGDVVSSGPGLPNDSPGGVAASDPIRQLDHEIIAAHAAGDAARLARLYHEAGRLLEDAGEPDRAYFVFTQAYINALESGERAVASVLWRRLKQAGREA